MALSIKNRPKGSVCSYRRAHRQTGTLLLLVGPHQAYLLSLAGTTTPTYRYALQWCNCMPLACPPSLVFGEVCTPRRRVEPQESTPLSRTLTDTYGYESGLVLCHRLVFLCPHVAGPTGCWPAHSLPATLTSLGSTGLSISIPESRMWSHKSPL